MRVIHDYLQGARCIVGYFRSVAYARVGVKDERFAVVGGGLALGGKVAHLAGYDREAAPVLACARRLNRSVKRQQVGLEGNVFDYLNDFEFCWSRVYYESSLAFSV